ncbi:YrbL family protein [Fulvimarina manganoxydans]|nr:YrbL family protein [Fulvimarina manganoxydans]
MSHIFQVSYRQKDLRYAGAGMERDVYHIASSPGLLAKVVKPGKGEADLACFREFRAYRNAGWPVAPIPKLYGTQVTEFGKAQIVDAILSPDGELGPTLYEVAESGALTERHLMDLNAFVDAVYRLRLTAFRFAPQNVVFGTRFSDRRSGFFIVDGFGDRQRFSRKELFARKRSRYLDDAMRRIEMRIGLPWDPMARTFSNVK